MRPLKKLQLLLFGDSNMSGFGVGAQEAFPASLEAMLRKREERFPPFLGDFDEKSSRPRTELKRGLISGADPSFIVTVRGYGRSGFGGVLPDDLNRHRSSHWVH